MEERRSANGIEIDPEQLSADALRGLIEEFVTREGTDYGSGEAWGGGPVDRALEDKVAHVRRQLASGEARIVYDPESESASIVPTRGLDDPDGEGSSPGRRGGPAPD